MPNDYSTLTEKLITELRGDGRPRLATLRAIDQVRGSRPRPFGWLPEWDFVDTAPTGRFEQERRWLLTQGYLMPTPEDTKREADRQAQHAKHEAARQARMRIQDEANMAEARRPAILPA